MCLFAVWAGWGWWAGWGGEALSQPALPALPGLLFSPDVLEIDRLLIDASPRRRDVVRELAGLVDRLRHDAEKVLRVGWHREPLGLSPRPLVRAERHAVRIEMEAGIHADVAVEFPVRQPQAIRHAVL